MSSTRREPEMSFRRKKRRPGDIAGDPSSRYIPTRAEVNRALEFLYNAQCNRGRFSIPSDPRDGIQLTLSDNAVGGPFYIQVADLFTTWGNDRILVGGAAEEHAETGKENEKGYVLPGRSLSTPGIVRAFGRDAAYLPYEQYVEISALTWPDPQYSTSQDELRAMCLKTTGGSYLGTAYEDYVFRARNYLNDSVASSARLTGTFMEDGFYLFILGWVRVIQVDEKDSSGTTHSIAKVLEIINPITDLYLEAKNDFGSRVPCKITGIAGSDYTVDIHADGKHEAATGAGVLQILQVHIEQTLSIGTWVYAERNGLQGI